jgi:hypothetical protein
MINLIKKLAKLDSANTTRLNEDTAMHHHALVSKHELTKEANNGGFDLDTTINNPAFNGKDEDIPDTIEIGVNYSITGSYLPASWDSRGGDPEEHPELDIEAIVNLETGEDISDLIDDSTRASIEQEIWDNDEQGKDEYDEDMSNQGNMGAHGDETISPIHGSQRKGENMNNLNLESLRYLAGVKNTLEECGISPMQGTNTPATINITAGSGQELTGMLKDIVNLAGVKQVQPHHMPVDSPNAGPSTVVSAPPMLGAMGHRDSNAEMHHLMAIIDGPDGQAAMNSPGYHGKTTEPMTAMGPAPSAGDEMRAVMDKINGDDAGGDDEETDEGIIGGTIGAGIGALVGGPAGAIAGYSTGSELGDDLTDEGSEQRMYDTSPDEHVMPDPLLQFGDINSGDHRERQKGLPVAKPMEATFKKLLADYEQFIAEGRPSVQPKGPAETEIPAYKRKQQRPVQAAAQAATDRRNANSGVKVWSSKRAEEGKKGKCCCNTDGEDQCPVHAKMDEERTMSRAAKGYEKYGKAGMQALAKAGRDGKDLDKVRDKYNKYDEATAPKDLPKKGEKIGKEGNALGNALRIARASGAKTMKVGGKTMPVKK